MTNPQSYDESLMVYNGAVDNVKPAVVVRPFDSNDVANVVRVVQQYGLSLSVKSGGHSASGACLKGDVVLDLSKSLNSVWVLDSDDKHPEPWVRVDGGAKVGDIDEAVCRRGYVAPLATYQGIGVGSILGGGLGYVSRLWGLSIDNVVEAEVVLADGSIVTCNEDDYSDLFWAIRGAGANFGVVTSVVLRLFPLKKCYSGMVIFPMETVDVAVQILTHWSQRCPAKTTPGELSTAAKIGTNANGDHVVVFSFCYAGSEVCLSSIWLTKILGGGSQVD
jgi:FAD/FMN-containing dehydrogenase